MQISENLSKAVWAFILIPAVVLLATAACTNRQVPDNAYEITTEWLTQPLDHQAPEKGDLKQQIHILTPENAPARAPVFFILGNENDAKAKDLERWYNAYGAPKDVIFILAEHRGYGQSISSDPDQSKPNYLTIPQALADYHRVTDQFGKRFPGPWIAAGYSYGGSLVINFAHDYPEDMKVILASSAVVRWPLFFDGYDLSIRKNMGEDFYNRMAGHTRSLTPEKPFDQTWHEREFIITMTLGINQYTSYQYLVPLFKVLSYLPTSSLISVLRFLDNHMAGGKGWTAARAFGKDGLSRDEALTGQYNWYTWKYQQCTRTGTMWTSGKVNGFFPKSKEDIVSECRLMFGQVRSEKASGEWCPAEMIPNLKVPQVYVIGEKDPWNDICVTGEKRVPQKDIMIFPGAFHCPDREDSDIGKKVLGRLRSYLPGPTF